MLETSKYFVEKHIVSTPFGLRVIAIITEREQLVCPCCGVVMAERSSVVGVVEL